MPVVRSFFRSRTSKRLISVCGTPQKMRSLFLSLLLSLLFVTLFTAFSPRFAQADPSGQCVLRPIMIRSIFALNACIIFPVPHFAQ